MSLTVDNTSEPFEMACNDVGGAGSGDYWCPFGAASDPIPFYRSEASVEPALTSTSTLSPASATTGIVADGFAAVRSPINHATAYLNLDFLYGRDEQTAQSLRTFEGGRMNLTDDGLPFLNVDGTWKVSVCTV